MEIEIRCGSHKALVLYLTSQLDAFLPDAAAPTSELIRQHLPAALRRLAPNLAAWKAYQPGRFDHLHSMQYATFLHLLANELFSRGAEGSGLCHRLYLLNKFLFGIDLGYRIAMPELFLLAHACTGTVFAEGNYGEKLVVFNNVTIAALDQQAPQLGQGVVLYPNSVVVGSTLIGDNSVVSAGAVLRNASVPPDSLVFKAPYGGVIRQSSKDYLGAYQR